MASVGWRDAKSTKSQPKRWDIVGGGGSQGDHDGGRIILY
jgi:hypothetical protein